MQPQKQGASNADHRLQVVDDAKNLTNRTSFGHYAGSLGLELLNGDCEKSSLRETFGRFSRPFVPQGGLNKRLPMLEASGDLFASQSHWCGAT